MTRYAADSRDRVFEAVDMVALVGAKVDLRRAGVNSYFGNCPFHDERTGSFHVSPDQRMYHCFGCQASGDAFTYVMETEGVDFKGALESLADRFGVRLETVEEDPRAAERRRRYERLHELMDRTATYYSRVLWESDEAAGARSYLEGRGVSAEVLREFRVGYAPDAWDRVLRGSQRAGYTQAEITDAGLARSGRNGAYDFFRERIMFPTADSRGRIRGFGARRMRDEQPGGKYVNTPDGPLYHKREILYGIDRARADAAKQGRMILVEGYTDVLAFHQAGVRNAVGIMGTSFTEEQLSELERVVKVLELCLDFDARGQAAMLRAARMAARRGVELRVVLLPEGSDPADLAVAEGAEGLRRRVAASVPFVTFDVERILSGEDTRSAEGRDRVLPELADAMANLAPSVLRDQLIRKISGALELSDARVADLLRERPSVPVDRRGGGGGVRSGDRDNGRPDGGVGANGAGGIDGGAPAAQAPAPGPRSERLFLALCIAVPDAGESTLAPGETPLLLSSEALRRAVRHLRGRVRTPLTDLPADDEPFARVMSGLVELAGRVPDPSPDRLEHARLVLDLERLDRAILRARAEGEGTSELAREREVARAAYREIVSRMEGTL